MAGVAEQAREDLVRIFRAAIAAVDPVLLVKRHLEREGARVVVLDGARPVARWKGDALVIGAGKAAARMAAGCEEVLGPERVRGLVTVPDGYDVPLSSIQAARADHPTPDARGVQATARICDLLRSRRRGAIIALISGGASSLLVRPRSPVTLGEKQEVTQRLLASGATIGAVNTVRKHLSLVKGGGLLRATAARPFVSLVLSDVVGDDPSVVGSGPTVPDTTRFEDACDVLAELRLGSELPLSVTDTLERGRRGEIEETLKPDDPAARGAENVLIGGNRLAIAGAEAEARRLGYETLVCEGALTGETTDSARRWIPGILAEAEHAAGRRLCVIAGGETTVTVRGPGRGGRNQEFALALAAPLAETKLCVLSAGTDGIDGPTDAAGAFVDGSTLGRSRALGLDPNAALFRNDSYGFFSALGDLFRCGPTGTNVMDITIALALP